ncbi:hypothetical protein TsFJ059_000364 [Trichoderma semiorbis]|uniref:Uncharacterized protein n=1 Tax=Trichoderma semiorbis TaxID=1491008 RepID=A0A9P8KU79_9HYPO|nr:hypothetical protein TsFJ059_000364 [Trichoderma semiorbis]
MASHNTTTTVWLFSSSACSVALPVFNGAADGTAQAKPASWPHSLPLLSPYFAGQDTHTHAQPTCRGADTHPDGHADDGPTVHMDTRVGAQMNAWMDSTHGWTLTIHRRCHTKPNLVPASIAGQGIEISESSQPGGWQRDPDAMQEDASPALAAPSLSILSPCTTLPQGPCVPIRYHGGMEHGQQSPYFTGPNRHSQAHPDRH